MVVGGSGRLGRELVARLEASEGIGEVDLADGCGAELDGALRGAQVLVHLERQPCPDFDHDDHAGEMSGLVAAVDEAAIDAVVVLSSAAVYGAWPDNPVPLTEEMPLRPNSGADFAIEKAEVERRWGAWSEAREGRTLAILRPALVVGDDAEQWLAVALRACTRWGIGDGEGPVQFVHVDDVAGAVVLAVDRRLDGVYNVAPDDWLGGEQVQVLTGTPVRPPVPPALAGALARWCWSRGLGGVAAEMVPYATHPWVVAGDRLRAEGWEPAHSCAETLVEAFPATPWTSFAARTRRVLSLGAGAVVGLGAPIVVMAIRGRHRIRQRQGLSPVAVGSRAPH